MRSGLSVDNSLRDLSDLYGGALRSNDLYSTSDHLKIWFAVPDILLGLKHLKTPFFFVQVLISVSTSQTFGPSDRYSIHRPIVKSNGVVPSTRNRFTWILVEIQIHVEAVK